MKKTSSGQQEQFGQLISGLPRDKAQGLIERGDLVQIMAMYGESLADVSRVDFKKALVGAINPYKEAKISWDEFVPNEPEHQLRLLSVIYPELDSSHVRDHLEKLGKLQAGENHFQVLPKISSVARVFEIEEDPFALEGYVACLDLMDSLVSLIPGRQSRMEGSEYLPDTFSEKRRQLEARFAGDFIVAPVMFQETRPQEWSFDFVASPGLDQVRFSAWDLGNFLLSSPSITAKGSFFCGEPNIEKSPLESDIWEVAGYSEEDEEGWFTFSRVYSHNSWGYFLNLVTR